MPEAIFGADGLLDYNARHKILICRQCQYAIQKNAVESHLLRPKIYRRDRQKLLPSIAKLELLDPDEVRFPNAGSPHVKGLPIFSGFRCTLAGCQNLTISVKRIKRHWTEAHCIERSLPELPSFTAPVKLQTFFRGAKIRYFEVDSARSLPVDSANLVSNENNGGEPEAGIVDGEIQNIPRSDRQARASTDVNGVAVLSEPDIDLEILKYFHHFTTKTSFSLYVARELQSSKQYWQDYVVSQAFKHGWLMCGVLALSAYHLALIADDVSDRDFHRQRALTFSSKFLDQPRHWVENQTPEAIEKIGSQISCYLQWLELTMSDLSTATGSSFPTSLWSTMSKLRYCFIDEANGHVSKLAAHSQKSHEIENCGIAPDIIERLDSLPCRIANILGRSENPLDVFATVSSVSKMIECCSISFANEDAHTAWLGMMTWLHLDLLPICPFRSSRRFTIINISKTQARVPL